MTHLLIFLGVTGGIILFVAWIYTLFSVYEEGPTLFEMNLWEKCCVLVWFLVCAIAVLVCVAIVGYTLWVGTS